MNFQWGKASLINSRKLNDLMKIFDRFSTIKNIKYLHDKRNCVQSQNASDRIEKIFATFIMWKS